MRKSSSGRDRNGSEVSSSRSERRRALDGEDDDTRSYRSRAETEGSSSARLKSSRKDDRDDASSSRRSTTSNNPFGFGIGSSDPPQRRKEPKSGRETTGEVDDRPSRRAEGRTENFGGTGSRGFDYEEGDDRRATTTNGDRRDSKRSERREARRDSKTSSSRSMGRESSRAIDGHDAQLPDNQFPGQIPDQYSRPYQPPGLAANYYGDQGESVQHQPGVRPNMPTVIHSAEQAHLMAPSAEANPPPEPSSMGQVGAAASFYNPTGSGADNYAPTTPSKPSRPGRTSSRPTSNSRYSPEPAASGPPGIGSLGAAAVGAGLGAAADYYAGANVNSSTSFAQQSSSSNQYNQYSQYASGSMSAPASASKPSGPQANDYNYGAAAAAAGLAGAAAAGYYAHQQHEHDHEAQYGHPFSPDPKFQSGMQQQLRRRRKGAFGRIADWWQDPEGIAQFEAYTETIGVCKYCFDPNSSPMDAPRKHYYHQSRPQFDQRLAAANGRVQKVYRNDSLNDDERRRRSSAMGAVAGGLAGYGVAKVGEQLYRQRHDFDDTYSVKSGRPLPTEELQNNESYSRRQDGNTVVRRSSRGNMYETRKVDRRESKRRDRRGDDEYVEQRRSSDQRNSNSAVGIGAAAAVAGAVAGMAARRRSRSRSRDRSGLRKKRSYYSKRVSPRHSYVDLSTKDSGPLGFGGFFNSPSANEKRGTRKGFFTLRNDSNSSSDMDLAFGEGTVRRKDSRKGKERQDDTAAILGLAATGAALAEESDRRRKVKQRRETTDYGTARFSRPPPGGATINLQDRERLSEVDDEGIWEDASDDESVDGVDLNLAYGTRLSAKNSRESLAEQGTTKWDWRWGKKKDRPKDSERRQSASFGQRPYAQSEQPQYSNGIPAAAMGAAVGMAAGAMMSGRRDQAAAPPAPMKYVDPMPITPDSRADGPSPKTTTMWNPVPLQQPDAVHAYPPGIPAVKKFEQDAQLTDSPVMMTSSEQRKLAEAEALAALEGRSNDRKRDSRASPPRANSSMVGRNSVSWSLTEEQLAKARSEEERQGRRDRKAENARRRSRQEQEVDLGGVPQRAPSPVGTDGSYRTSLTSREAEIEQELKALRAEQARVAKESSTAAEKKIDKQEKSVAVKSALAGASIGAIAAAMIKNRRAKTVEKVKDSDGQSGGADTPTRKSSLKKSSRDTSEVDRSSSPQQETQEERIARMAAKRVNSPVEHESYGDFFLPPEIAADLKKNNAKSAAEEVANIVTIAPPEDSDTEPERVLPHFDPFLYRKFGSSSKHTDAGLPRGVPILELIEPTPPGSRSSSKVRERSPSPLRQTRTESAEPDPIPEPEEGVDDRRDRRGSVGSKRSSVNWGVNTTHEFDVQTPEDERRDPVLDQKGLAENAPLNGSRLSRGEGEDDLRKVYTIEDDQVVRDNIQSGVPPVEEMTPAQREHVSLGRDFSDLPRTQEDYEPVASGRTAKFTSAAESALNDLLEEKINYQSPVAGTTNDLGGTSEYTRASDVPKTGHGYVEEPSLPDSPQVERTYRADGTTRDRPSVDDAEVPSESRASRSQRRRLERARSSAEDATPMAVESGAEPVGSVQPEDDEYASAHEMPGGFHAFDYMVDDQGKPLSPEANRDIEAAAASQLSRRSQESEVKPRSSKEASRSYHDFSRDKTTDDIPIDHAARPKTAYASDPEDWEKSNGKKSKSKKHRDRDSKAEDASRAAATIAGVAVGAAAAAFAASEDGHKRQREQSSERARPVSRAESTERVRGQKSDESFYSQSNTSEPDFYEGEEKKRKSKRDSDAFDDVSDDKSITSATTSKSEERRSKRRSKRDSDIYDDDDTKSVTSASADQSGEKKRRKKRESSGLEDDDDAKSQASTASEKRRSKDKSREKESDRDKKDEKRSSGFFSGLFGGSKSDVTSSSRKTSKSEARAERDRDRKRDEDDGELEDESRKKRRSKSGRKTEDGTSDQPDPANTRLETAPVEVVDLHKAASDQEDSQLELDSPLEEKRSRRQVEDESFLADRPEMPLPTDMPMVTNGVSGRQTERPEIATPQVAADADMALADSSSTFPPWSGTPARRQPPVRLSSIRTDMYNSAAAISPTAVPLHFGRRHTITPGSAQRSTTSAQTSSPLTTPRPRAGRPKSTDGKDFRPLYLVERHGSANTPEAEQMDHYPSLPSSRTTSAHASQEDLQATAQEGQAQSQLSLQISPGRLGERRHSISDTRDVAEFLDSRSTTPVPGEKQRERDRLEEIRHHRNREAELKHMFHSPSELLQEPDDPAGVEPDDREYRLPSIVSQSQDESDAFMSAESRAGSPEFGTVSSKDRPPRPRSASRERHRARSASSRIGVRHPSASRERKRPSRSDPTLGMGIAVAGGVLAGLAAQSALSSTTGVTDDEKGHRPDTQRVERDYTRSTAEPDFNDFYPESAYPDTPASQQTIDLGGEPQRRPSVSQEQWGKQSNPSTLVGKRSKDDGAEPGDDDRIYSYEAKAFDQAPEKKSQEQGAEMTIPVRPGTAHAAERSQFSVEDTSQAVARSDKPHSADLERTVQDQVIDDSAIAPLDEPESHEGAATTAAAVAGALLAQQTGRPHDAFEGDSQVREVDLTLPNKPTTPEHLIEERFVPSFDELDRSDNSLGAFEEAFSRAVTARGLPDGVARQEAMNVFLTRRDNAPFFPKEDLSPVPEGRGTPVAHSASPSESQTSINKNASQVGQYGGATEILQAPENPAELLQHTEDTTAVPVAATNEDDEDEWAQSTKKSKSDKKKKKGSKSRRSTTDWTDDVSPAVAVGGGVAAAAVAAGLLDRNVESRDAEDSATQQPEPDFDVGRIANLDRSQTQSSIAPSEDDSLAVSSSKKGKKDKKKKKRQSTIAEPDEKLPSPPEDTPRELEPPPRVVDWSKVDSDIGAATARSSRSDIGETEEAEPRAGLAFSTDLSRERGPDREVEEDFEASQQRGPDEFQDADEDNRATLSRKSSKKDKKKKKRQSLVSTAVDETVNTPEAASARDQPDGDLPEGVSQPQMPMASEDFMEPRELPDPRLDVSKSENHSPGQQQQAQKPEQVQAQEWQEPEPMVVQQEPEPNVPVQSIRRGARSQPTPPPAAASLLGKPFSIAEVAGLALGKTMMSLHKAKPTTPTDAEKPKAGQGSGWSSWSNYSPEVSAANVTHEEAKSDSTFPEQSEQRSPEGKAAEDALPRTADTGPTTVSAKNEHLQQADQGHNLTEAEETSSPAGEDNVREDDTELLTMKSTKSKKKSKRNRKSLVETTIDDGNAVEHETGEEVPPESPVLIEPLEMETASHPDAKASTDLGRADTDLADDSSKIVEELDERPRSNAVFSGAEEGDYSSAPSTSKKSKKDKKKRKSTTSEFSDFATASDPVVDEKTRDLQPTVSSFEAEMANTFAPKDLNETLVQAGTDTVETPEATLRSVEDIWQTTDKLSKKEKKRRKSGTATPIEDAAIITSEEIESGDRTKLDDEPPAETDQSSAPEQAEAEAEAGLGRSDDRTLADDDQWSTSIKPSKKEKRKKRQSKSSIPVEETTMEDVESRAEGSVPAESLSNELLPSSAERAESDFVSDERELMSESIEQSTQGFDEWKPWDLGLNKKERKKKEKELRSQGFDPDAMLIPPPRSDIVTQQPLKETGVEPEPEGILSHDLSNEAEQTMPDDVEPWKPWDFGLSKKERKKKEKELRSQGLDPDAMLVPPSILKSSSELAAGERDASREPDEPTIREATPELVEQDTQENEDWKPWDFGLNKKERKKKEKDLRSQGLDPDAMLIPPSSRGLAPVLVAEEADYNQEPKESTLHSLASEAAPAGMEEAQEWRPWDFGLTKKERKKKEKELLSQGFDPDAMLIPPSAPEPDAEDWIEAQRAESTMPGGFKEPEAPTELDQNTTAATEEEFDWGFPTGPSKQDKKKKKSRRSTEASTPAESADERSRLDDWIAEQPLDDKETPFNDQSAKDFQEHIPPTYDPASAKSLHEEPKHQGWLAGMHARASTFPRRPEQTDPLEEQFEHGRHGGSTNVPEHVDADSDFAFTSKQSKKDKKKKSRSSSAHAEGGIDAKILLAGAAAAAVAEATLRAEQQGATEAEVQQAARDAIVDTTDKLGKDYADEEPMMTDNVVTGPIRSGNDEDFAGTTAYGAHDASRYDSADGEAWAEAETGEDYHRGREKFDKDRSPQDMHMYDDAILTTRKDEEEAEMSRDIAASIPDGEISYGHEGEASSFNTPAETPGNEAEAFNWAPILKKGKKDKKKRKSVAWSDADTSTPATPANEPAEEEGNISANAGNARSSEDNVVLLEPLHAASNDQQPAHHSEAAKPDLPTPGTEREEFEWTGIESSIKSKKDKKKKKRGSLLASANEISPAEQVTSTIQDSTLTEPELESRPEPAREDMNEEEWGFPTKKSKKDKKKKKRGSSSHDDDFTDYSQNVASNVSREVDTEPKKPAAPTIEPDIIAATSATAASVILDAPQPENFGLHEDHAQNTRTDPLGEEIAVDRDAEQGHLHPVEEAKWESTTQKSRKDKKRTSLVTDDEIAGEAKPSMGDSEPQIGQGGNHEAHTDDSHIRDANAEDLHNSAVHQNWLAGAYEAARSFPSRMAPIETEPTHEVGAEDSDGSNVSASTRERRRRRRSPPLSREHDPEDLPRNRTLTPPPDDDALMDTALGVAAALGIGASEGDRHHRDEHRRTISSDGAHKAERSLRDSGLVESPVLQQEDVGEIRDSGYMPSPPMEESWNEHDDRQHRRPRPRSPTSSTEDVREAKHHSTKEIEEIETPQRRQPSPPVSTSKDRSSVVFLSSPAGQTPKTPQSSEKPYPTGDLLDAPTGGLHRTPSVHGNRRSREMLRDEAVERSTTDLHRVPTIHGHHHRSREELRQLMNEPFPSTHQRARAGVDVDEAESTPTNHRSTPAHGRDRSASPSKGPLHTIHEGRSATEVMAAAAALGVGAATAAHASPSSTGNPTSRVRSTGKRRSQVDSLHDLHETTPAAPSDPRDVEPSPSHDRHDPSASARDMADAYEGYGSYPGSPRSPTRPPSVRKRQSMQQIQDLQAKVDQLASENRKLAEDKIVAEQHLQQFQIESAQSGGNQEELKTAQTQLQERDQQIGKLQAEIASLAATHANLRGEHERSYSDLQQQHDHAQTQWSQSTRELEGLRTQHAELSSGMEGMVRHEIDSALAEKNAEIQRLQADLDEARQKIRELESQILARNANDIVVVRDEDYFDNACQQLCQHVQSWVLRFSKFSDNRVCRTTNEVRDEKVVDRFDNAVLDGSDVDVYLADRTRRRDIFMSVVMTMIWEYVFTRYLFGMDRDQRQKLKQLEKNLAEVGPASAVHQWRALTLTLLAKRDAFQQQCDNDTEAVVLEVLSTLSKFLPPPQNLEAQMQDSLRKVMGYAVQLSIEMRTQKAEYIMLPPLQPEYNTEGDLARKVYFNASLMNERSGGTTSNDSLEQTRAVVRVVLFPLVVKKGDDAGNGDEEIVVCPAQVLVARPDQGKRPKSRITSGGSIRAPSRGSTHSLAMSGVDATGAGNMI